MNVVTIDFDIIMAPCINLYNMWIDKGNHNINNVLSDYPFLENMNADLVIYKKLTEYIINAISHLEAENVYFIESHETIVKYIKDDIITLYNIDHHHDITYHMEPEILKVPLLECLCNDWVKFLRDNQQIKKYIWINNNNSDVLGKDLLRWYPTQVEKIKIFNLDELAQKTDKLFICKSPEWILPTYLPLFELWKSLCEKYYQKKFELL